MYGMRLDTKEKRLQARQFYFREGMTVIDMPEIDFQAFISDEPDHYTLKYFIGTAGKPRENYYYRTKEKRDEALQKAIDAQRKHLEYKAQQKQENKGKLTGAAATAAAIRARLKKEFPGVKFSVRSSNFSMGNSVDIDWTDGPFYDQVNDITYQYCYGRFDGMQDLAYNVKIDSEGLGCPGAKFVHCQRHLSPERKAQIKEVLEAQFVPHDGPGRDYYAPYQWEQAEKVLLGIHQQEEELPEVVEAQEEAVSSVEPDPSASSRNSYNLDCGCTVHHKTLFTSCKGCGKSLCASHIYYYVDEANQAITTHSPGLCRECYEAKHGPQRQFNKPSAGAKVYDFTAKLRAKQEQQAFDSSLSKFKTDYLPYLTRDDISLLVSCPEDQQTEAMVKICTRIDLERSRG